MANICTLAPDINQCPHYDQKTQMCKDGPEVCGFYKKQMQRRRRKHRSGPNGLNNI